MNIVSNRRRRHTDHFILERTKTWLPWVMEWTKA